MRYNSETPNVTDGIDIKDWVIDLPDGTNLTFSMWDFGKGTYYKIRLAFVLLFTNNSSF